MTSQRDTGRERLLPRPLIRLIGRDRDVDEIVATLLDPATSLLTLTGPGGVGKTSLARHIAAILERVFEDGVHVVALKHLQDPDLVAPTLADALSIIPAPAQPAIQQLTRYLRDRNLLLILDNMEQVIESSHFLTPLRESCPHLRILVTSREALHLTGERLFTVQPLDVPSPLGHRPLDLPNRETPAVQLFVERARAVRHDFELTSDNRRHVEEICRRTDGLPLAIELAAARLRSYSISTLASIFRNRLTLLAGQSRDTPVRLHTMRNAVQWSYDLLPRPERRLLCRLAVFTGGFTIDGAEIVVRELTADLAGTGVGRNPSADSMAEVVEDIGSLVDKSLVTVLDRSTNGERFGMLETIRDFALECLRATDEHEAIRFRHARWYLHLAETTDVLAAVRNSEHVSLDRIASELDNFRAALAWFDDTGQTGELARLCVELGAYWHARNHLAEGYGWARKVIETHDLRTIPVPLRIKLLHSTGRDAWHLGSFTEASTYLNAALSLAREAGDIGAELSALLDLGVSAEMQGDDLSAYEWFQLVLDGHREHGNPRGILVALTNLGDAAYRLGNIADAIRMSTEALRLADSFSDRDLACLVRGNLGQIALVQDDVRAAWQHYQEEMRLALTTHHDLFLADGLAGMAGVALIQNRARECGLLLGASHAFRERFGARRVPHHLIEDRTATGLRALVPAETMESLLAQGSAFTIADALAVVDRLELQEPVIVANPGLTSLSEREAVVLQLLALGKTDRAIGSDLYISHRTVMRHVAAIFRKLGVNNRAAAAHIANGQVLD